MPALLGFVPEHSIVLICLSRGSTTTVRMTVRQDLPDPPATGEVFHAIERCAQVCDREAYDAIVAVLVVGDRGAEDGGVDLAAVGLQQLVSPLAPVRRQAVRGGHAGG